MNILKTILFPLLVAFISVDCTNINPILNIQPKIQLPHQDPSLMGITVSVNGVEQYNGQVLAKVNHNGQMITLTPSRDLRFLLQEVLEKQMTSRGYMIGPHGAVDLQIVVNNLYADVTQGNVRHSITTKADISIISTARNGNKQIKNYHQTDSIEGVFTATNAKITNAVNSTLSDVIADMAQDTSVHNFIKHNTY